MTSGWLTLFSEKGHPCLLIVMNYGKFFFNANVKNLENRFCLKFFWLRLADLSKYLNLILNWFKILPTTGFADLIVRSLSWNDNIKVPHSKCRDVWSVLGGGYPMDGLSFVVDSGLEEDSTGPLFTKSHISVLHRVSKP